MASERSARVVYFDGECGLCDHFVQFLIRHDRDRHLSFATLQGETATKLLGPMSPDHLAWSVRFQDEGQMFDSSSAALRSIAALGGPWKATLALLLVPPFIRDGVYRFIASRRYRLFGRFEQCMVPSAALRERFLP